jgi:hypothetical protein
MKKTALVIALAIASLNQAHAQYAAPTPAPQKQMRFLLGGGLTFGGDKLITVEYDNGVEMDIRAGGMLAFNAGVDYRITNEFSMQATAGYHVDNTSARNGDARFTRMPIEVLAYYHVGPQWRVGAGARYVSNPKLKLSGAVGNGDVAFDNAVSGLVEAEYIMGEHLGIKVRYVRETYEKKPFTDKIDGSHVGILANYYF